MLYNNINSLVVILIFGSLHLLAFIKFSNPLKINRKGNLWFAFFLLLFASFWIEEIASYCGFSEINIVFISSVHMLQILTPLVLYFSILSYTIPTFKLKQKHLPHLIIPIIYLIVKVFMLLLLNNESIKTLSIVIILFQAMLYSLMSYFKILNHQKKILVYSSNTSGISLKWLEYILIQIIIICVVVLFHNIFISTSDLNLFVNTVNLVTVYVIAFFSLRQKEIYPVENIQVADLDFITEPQKEIKDKKKLVQDEELESEKNRLIHLMNTKQPFLDSELNLVKLSAMLSLTPHQMSYIINAGFNENFFQFVNRHRVERAKELLKLDDEKMTMLAVAFDAGFNSKTAFNTTFKKITRQTPTEFKNQQNGNTG